MRKTISESERQRAVREHAEHLLAQFGLAADGWMFRWNRRRTKLGRCYFPIAERPGRVELSIHHPS
jgi:hypothetical protein